jgi:hypothetical protein
LQLADVFLDFGDHAQCGEAFPERNIDLLLEIFEQQMILLGESGGDVMVIEVLRHRAGR